MVAGVAVGTASHSERKLEPRSMQILHDRAAVMVLAKVVSVRDFTEPLDLQIENVRTAGIPSRMACSEIHTVRAVACKR